MNAADVAQIASATFTAVAAGAALMTVRQAAADRKVAIAAYETETQPLITDLPFGLVHEEIDWHEASGEMSKRRIDRAEISVGCAGPEPIAGATVPVRNVGNGCARIHAVVFRLADGSEGTGVARNPILPPDELTYASLWAAPNDDGVAVGESIGMEYQDFSVILGYGDASGRPREAVRLDISNGEHPRVTARTWAPDVNALRVTSSSRERDRAAGERSP